MRREAGKENLLVADVEEKQEIDASKKFLCRFCQVCRRNLSRKNGMWKKQSQSSTRRESSEEFLVDLDEQEFMETLIYRAKEVGSAHGLCNGVQITKKKTSGIHLLAPEDSKEKDCDDHWQG